MDATLEEIEFIARSTHRAGTLEALAEHPLDRHDLREATGASASTIARVLSDFEDRRWIERHNAIYELTPLGEYVAAQFGGLYGAMETERTLRDVWRWLPREMDGFSVDLFADAVISYPGPGYPYEPVERVSSLFEETTAMCGFGTTVFKSVNNETVCRRIMDGMEYEYIYSPSVLGATVDWNPERVASAAARENCTILLHDDLPDAERCGLGIFDDRIGICCHDRKTGQLEAVVDTAAPAAREWAIAVYERHRAEARPVSRREKADLFPEDVIV